MTLTETVRAHVNEVLKKRGNGGFSLRRVVGAVLLLVWGGSWMMDKAIAAAAPDSMVALAWNAAPMLVGLALLAPDAYKSVTSLLKREHKE